MPGPTRNGRFAYSAINTVLSTNTRIVAVVAAPRSMPLADSSDGITTSK